MWLQRALLAFLVCAAAACSGAKSKPTSDPGGRLSARYFPMKVGDKWLYEDSYFSRTQRMEVSVVRQADPNTFVFRMKPADLELPQGQKPAEVKMQVRPRGIFDGARYLLEEPLQVGKKWLAVVNATTAERFEIVTLDAKADVPAGTFERCMLVRSTIRQPAEEQQVTDVTYCPDVGMVERTVTVSKPGKPTITVWHGKLLYYESGGARVYPKKLSD